MLPGLVSTRHLHPGDLCGLFPWIPAGPVLDIGCGSGYLSAALAHWGFDVTALETDPHQLQAASKRYYGAQIHWQQEDIRAHRLNRESLAAVFFLNGLPFIPNGERARLIGRMKAALKPQGLLVLSGYTSEDPSASGRLATSPNRLHQRPTGVLAPGELLERLRGWELLFFFEGWAWLDEGPVGPGRHHISQIIARRPGRGRVACLSGTGVGWTAELEKAVPEAWPDFWEIPLEGVLERTADQTLLRLLRQRPVILRARGAGPALEWVTPELKRLLQRLDSPWWILPLALWSEQTGLSLPLPTGPEIYDAFQAQMQSLSAQLAVPILLENSLISFTSGPGEGDLISRLAENCACGISLDLGLLCQSAALHGFSPADWLRPVPAERVQLLRLPADTRLSWYAEAWRLARQILPQIPAHCLVLDPAPPTEGLWTEQLKQARRWLREARV